MDNKTKQHLDELFEKRQQADEAKREELAKIKQIATDKEPFDIKELEKYYSLAYKYPGVEITQDTIDVYEMMYYLDYPKVKTLEEFGNELEDYDVVEN